jgi:hypothetical protein
MDAGIRALIAGVDARDMPGKRSKGGAARSKAGKVKQN